MIAFLEGELKHKFLNMVVVVTAGVGYGVRVSSDDWDRLQKDSRVSLFIHEHIREDAHDLYGFLNFQAQELFNQLLEAKGIGPKGAMSILSIGSLGDIRSAIARGNTAYIARAPGVGKKVAERIIVDLKDKVGLPTSDAATSFLQSGTATNDDALQSLIALGYSVNDAQEALREIDPSLNTELRIKLALKR